MPKSQTEKYLTDMKELPDYSDDQEKHRHRGGVESDHDNALAVPSSANRSSSLRKPHTLEQDGRHEEEIKKEKKLHDSKVVVHEETITKPDLKSEVKLTGDGNNEASKKQKEKAEPLKVMENGIKESEGGEKVLTIERRVSLKNFSTKDLILGVMNILAVISLIVLLTKLPGKGTELKRLKNEQLQNQTGAPVNSKEIEESGHKAKELEELFIKNQDVFEFASALDRLKTNSKVVGWEFASQLAVKDRTGNMGLPVIITLRGNSLEELLPELSKIRRLPYLFRPISIEVGPARDLTGEGQGLIEFKYGILLYVN